MGYRVVNGKIQVFEDFSPLPKQNKINDSNSKTFKSVLKDELQKESFVISNHAASRLEDRNISLNESDMKKINEGINKAEEKGCKDCLILYRDVAMVASIKNRTIITAVDKESSKGNVFTNIDSVVLL